MNIIYVAIFFILSSYWTNGQNLFIKTYGNNNDRPLIFLHGGPGYNSANFEATTAQKLADKSFFVIVYDRRGEGRSKDQNAKFTFNESFDDLNTIYEMYGIKKSTLIGHSFGGILATLFAEKFPQKIQQVILVGAPVSLQETFNTILTSSKNIYQTKNDSTGLKYIELIEKMDKNSLEYSSYSFMHAMKNGFYSPKIPSEEAKIIYSGFKTDSILIKYSSQMTFQAAQGFWKNEKYTTIDLTNNLKNLQSEHIKIFAIYGKDDGLYSPEQVKQLQNLLGSNNVKYLDNCSHNVFIDQQTQFIKEISNCVKPD